MNPRRIVSRAALDDWLTAEILKIPGCENCALASKYIVGEPRKNNGCNWAGLTIRVGEGADAQAVTKAAAAIEQQASLLFNLDTVAPGLRVEALSVQMSRRLLYTPVFHLDPDLINARPSLPEVGHGSGVGTPAELTAHLQRYQEAGVDQVIFIQQGGRNRHDHICEALHLFASKVMPALKEGDRAREARKQEELAPYIAAAMARKPIRAPAAESAIPVVPAYGNTILQPGQAAEGPTHHIHSDITVMTTDPAEKPDLAEKAAAEG